MRDDDHFQVTTLDFGFHDQDAARQRLLREDGDRAGAEQDRTGSRQPHRECGMGKNLNRRVSDVHGSSLFRPGQAACGRDVTGAPASAGRVCRMQERPGRPDGIHNQRREYGEGMVTYRCPACGHWLDRNAGT